jgi:hypothetical protein
MALRSEAIDCGCVDAEEVAFSNVGTETSVGRYAGAGRVRDRAATGAVERLGGWQF